MTEQPSTGRPLALIRTLVSQSPRAYAYVALAAALATVPSVVVPLLERAFVDQYLVSGNRQWSTPVVIGMVAAALLIATATLLQYRTLARLSVRIGATASTRLAWQILRLPVPTIERWGTGDLTARVGALQYYSLLSGLFVPMALANIVTIAVYTIVVVTLNWVLALAGLATVACSVLASSVLLRRRRILQSRADATLIELTAGTTHTVASIETIKAAGWEPWIFDRWSQRRSEAIDAWSELAMDSQRVGLVPTLTYTFGLGLTLAVGSLLVFAGDLSLGTLAAAQTLLLAVFVLTRQLVTIGTLVEWVGSIQRQADAVAVLDLDPEATSTGTGRVRTDGPLELELRDVTFGYEAAEPPLLSDLALHVPAGSWLAVVGASGSGKSTLSRLAIGELQPWGGSVLLDGSPRLDLARRERALRVGYVPQHPVLMPGTIAENITMFDPTVPAEAIRRALVDARVLDVVEERADGLEERITSTGHGFSGGELQRLAIARALVRDPGLLILDEATSALDPITEFEMIRTLRDRGCTCLVVAHRLSSVRDADRIIVMERGMIVEQGSFDELRLGGRFAELASG
ncbi:MAG: hypothetical protein RL190_531 [Actinomycetota bacterium]